MDPSQSQNFSNGTGLAILSIVLAIALPPVGLVISIISLVRQRKRRQNTGLSLAALIVSSLLSMLIAIPLAIYLFIFWLAGGGKANTSYDAVKPLLTQIERSGGTKICENGDNGYSISNTTPWYDAYYLLPDSAATVKDITTIANKQGISLKNDETPVVTFNDEAQNNLIGQSGGASIRVSVYEDTTVRLYCNDGEYGRAMSTGPDAIVLFSTQSPSTR